MAARLLALQKNCQGVWLMYLVLALLCVCVFWGVEYNQIVNLFTNPVFVFPPESTQKNTSSHDVVTASTGSVKQVIRTAVGRKDGIRSELACGILCFYDLSTKA